MDKKEYPQVLLAVTGASGAIYARVLLARLLEAGVAVGLTMSRYGEQVARAELGDAATPVSLLLGHEDTRVIYYPIDDYSGPFASGSFSWKAVAIVPCSLGTAGRIAAGISNDLITRAADVALKEKRTLLLSPRETPLNLIQLRNLTTLAEAGAIIAPPMPAFYEHPQTIEEMVEQTVARLFATLVL